MRASIIIAAYNEGSKLIKTIESTVGSLENLDYDIVVVDDASTDASIDLVSAQFPWIKIVRHSSRQGISQTKAHGADEATGDVLVFLDGHTKPEENAIAQLTHDVEALEGEAIVVPAIADLNTHQWTNNHHQVGHGYAVDLETFDTQWKDMEELHVADGMRAKLYESPALIGCVFAISRTLYRKLWGFDAHMRSWGVEDLDLGLKSWLMGYRVLHDPQAIVGHRFRDTFEYIVPAEHLLVNQLRMAYKNLTVSAWENWVDQCRQRSPERLAEFENASWARETSRLLNTYPVIQPFHYAFRLRPDEQAYFGKGERYRSFAAVHATFPSISRVGSFFHHGHTGFAWAAKREIVEDIGLYDAAVAGGSDHLMAHAFCGDFGSRCLYEMFLNASGFLNHYRGWATAAWRKVQGKIFFVPGAILHLWHGEMHNRQYPNRMVEFAHLDFNPSLDLLVDNNGLWQWSEHNPALASWATTYFARRLEDESQRHITEEA